ncbi:MAG: hypothetical protein U9O94_10690 [Nanoarchaeota archaeon]|nr:hypothetical protein [Nanoarchaeota archaeon]
MEGGAQKVPPSKPQGYRNSTDEEQYLYCKTFIPEIAGTYKGTLVICGGGKSMWEDLAQARSLLDGKHYDIMAVNIAGLFIMGLTHLFSLHFKQITYIKKFRDVEYAGEKKILVHGIREWEGIDYTWYPAMMASTSGFMAVVLGWLLGYRKFILCGVSMDGSGYFYKPTFNATFDDKYRREEIDKMKNKFGEQLKSMSGRTKDVFGAPDKEWIRSSYV